ncbi:MAG: hypothetical protein ABJG41_00100 [Cyclobacteriaceae bacterium]
MRIIQLLLLTLVFLSCRTETDELLGHWHSVPLEDGTYWTLDVTDTSTQINKYDIWNGEWPFNRFDENGKEVIVFLMEECKDFEIRYDTLFLTELFKFTRVHENNHLTDYFTNSMVQLNLPKTTPASQLELPEIKQWVPIYVGPPKKGSELSELINSDSTCIQTWDVTINYQDLEKFAQQEYKKWSPKNPNYWLLINADSSTSQLVIDSIRTTLEPFNFIEGFILTRFNYEQDRLEFEKLNGK